MSPALRSNPTVERAKRELARLATPGSKVLLAVSGGADSIGLMHLAAEVAADIGIYLHVGFVNHGLREGIDREFAIVASQADALGIEVERSDVAPEKASRAREFGSVQAWAREVRYELLADTAKRVGARYIATGHTKDDQVETVLIHMLRGTGLDGFRGIPERRSVAGGEVIRPLLWISRVEIRDLLRSRKVEWAEDPSNDDARYLRTRVRHELLPLMEGLQPGAGKRIAALALEAGFAVDFVDSAILDRKLFENLRLAGGVKVDGEVFSKLPYGLWSRVVRFALCMVRGDLRRIERAHLEQIEELIKSGAGEAAIPGEAVVYLDRGSLFVFSGPIPARPQGAGRPRAVGGGLWRAGLDQLGAEVEIGADSEERVRGMEVRSRLPGDRLWDSGTKLKEIFIECRVPRPYRDFVPVLAEGDRVISCPGLVPNRRRDIEVRWSFRDSAPFLDLSLCQKLDQ